MTRYGYIGLGDMGSAMGENLIRNSSDVTVYDINPEAIQEAVHNPELLSTYSWRLILPTIAIKLKFGPLQRLVLGDWYARDDVHAGLRTNRLIIG